MVLEPPDLLELTDSMVEEAGVGTNSDTMLVLEHLLALCHMHGLQGLRTLGLSSAATGFTTVFTRPDFTDAMLFDYLTMHGASGCAVQNQVVEVITSEQVRDQCVGAIRDGSLSRASRD